MFIPPWLVVVIVVAVLLAVWPGIWRELSALLLMLFVFSVFASFLGLIYFGVIKQDKESAILVSIPLIALAVWGALSEGIDTLRTSQELHHLRVRFASHPTKVKALRESYAKAIDLPHKMWNLRSSIKHFPSWYATTNADGTPWSSSMISVDSITTIKAAGNPDSGGFDLSAVGNPPFLLSHSPRMRRITRFARATASQFTVPVTTPTGSRWPRAVFG